MKRPDIPPMLTEAQALAYGFTEELEEGERRRITSQLERAAK